MRISLKKSGNLGHSMQLRRLFQISGIPPQANVKQLIKDEPEFAAQLEQEIKEKIAEVQATSDKKYQPKAAPKADTEPEPAEESTARQTRAAARAKLDIAVEDDDE